MAPIAQETGLKSGATIYLCCHGSQVHSRSLGAGAGMLDEDSRLWLGHVRVCLRQHVLEATGGLHLERLRHRHRRDDTNEFIYAGFGWSICTSRGEGAEDLRLDLGLILQAAIHVQATLSIDSLAELLSLTGLRLGHFVEWCDYVTIQLDSETMSSS
jgi:hypothetical protein